MTIDRCVVCAKLVTSQAIGTALEDNSVWSVMLADFCHDCSEELTELPIIDEWLEWYVQ